MICSKKTIYSIASPLGSRRPQETAAIRHSRMVTRNSSWHATQKAQATRWPAVVRMSSNAFLRYLQRDWAMSSGCYSRSRPRAQRGQLRPRARSKFGPPMLEPEIFCSKQSFFGSKFTVLTNVLLLLLGLFGATRSHSAPGEMCPPSLRPWKPRPSRSKKLAHVWANFFIFAKKTHNNIWVKTGHRITGG